MSVETFFCRNCNFSIEQEQKFCPNCGQKTATDDQIISFPEGAECDTCGAELAQEQKFCGNCGIEIDWSPAENSQISEETSPEKVKSIFLGKDEVIAVIAMVIGIVFLVSIFWPERKDLQEECFQQQMSKLGSIIEPKNWAIESRIYCQSLHP
jgi:uncharacterized membrane protein YvbJ